jgi:murein DD-endopeptidase MepM/ murein hydrolase activator NlpD
MQTLTIQGLSAALATPLRFLRLRFLALAAGFGLLAACGGQAPPAFAPQRAEPVTVTVQRGDTLIGIARRHGVALAPLAVANGLAPPYVIRPGQVLHVPGAAAVAPPVGLATGGSSLGVSQAMAEAPPAITPPPASAAQGVEARAVVAEALPPPGPPPPPPSASLASPPQAAPVAAATAEASATPRAGPSARTTASPAAETARAAPREAAPPARRLPPGRFAWPVRGPVVSGFGDKGGGLVNDGINIAAPRGTPVRAAAEGTVIYAGNGVRGFGNLVLIRHEGGWVTAYGHNERLLVRQGQAVGAGEEIARVGSTGAVASPQLHFQVRRSGRPVDPAAHLSRTIAGR